MNRRHDWRSLLVESDLPPAVTGLVRELVQRTGLWRSERYAVTLELLAHFHDGLDAGRNTEELLQSFGDPRQAARLITRAKRRGRPWWWRTRRRVGQILLLLIVIYVVLWAWLITGRPRPSVDYLAKLNVEAVAVPEEQRAWPIYREAWTRGRIWDLKLDDLYVETATGSRMPLPGEPGWERVAALVGEHAELVDALRRGGLMPGMGLPLYQASDFPAEDWLALQGPQASRPEAPETGSSMLFAVLLPHLSRMRMSARLLAADLHLAAVSGDPARVVTDYQAMLGMASQSREAPTLIGQLVGVSIASIANQTLAKALMDRPEAFSTEALIDLVHAAARADRLGEVDLSGEHMMLQDVVQHVYSDDGHGDGHMTVEGVRLMRSLAGPSLGNDEDVDLLNRGTSALLPAIVAVSASRRELSAAAEQLYAVMEADLRRPMWEQLRQTGRSESQILQWRHTWLDRTRYATLCLLTPAVTAAGKRFQQMLAQRDALQVALALEVHRRQHGQYPAALTDLVPHDLPVVPVDRSTGLPLLYLLRDGQPVLYGRGLNDTDDEGVWDGSVRWPQVPKTGDWVLHPPVIEPLTAE